MNRRRRNELALHTVLFHPPPRNGWLAEARDRDLKLDLATCMADIVGLLDGAGLVAFPAGFMRAPSLDACDALAQRLLALSRRAGLSLLFGIDVVAEDRWAPLAPPAESYAFACEAGRPVLWPAHVGRGTGRGEGPAEARCVELGGMRVGVVIASEVFNAPLRRELARGRPDLTVVLTHVGPNERWRAALEGLAAIAPTVLVGESVTGKIPLWTAAPDGWQRTDLGGAPNVTLQRYR
ncbi:MAG TPA: hypothetical protein VMZ28_20130, partial [Kofleriaceae bacterium]|nr:hypothetical protein [Kofleriaceae bacterium]